MRSYWDETGTASEVPIHRKIWEWAFIASSLEAHGMLRPGMVGLGFGVGKEPLTPLFASMGCKIVATDQSPQTALSEGWSESGQFAGTISSLNEHGLCDTERFEEQVSFRTVDMRDIPKDLIGFDFTWSSCAFEHLGTISKGLEFLTRQMRCLRRGGIAVHTTEFNISSNEATIEAGPTVLYRKTDLELLSSQLRHRGHVLDLDFTLGSSEMDLQVDRPPFSGPHLRLEHDGYVITSYGIVIRKGRRKLAMPKRPTKSR